MENSQIYLVHTLFRFLYECFIGEEFEDEENEGEKILSEEEFKNLAIAKIE